MVKDNHPDRNIKKNKPVKILHVLNSLNIGGLENGVVNLINNMDKSRFRHTICCIRQKGPMAARILRKDTPIFSLNLENRDRFAFLKIAKIILTNSPDIIHTRNYGTIDGILAALIARHGVVIHGEHGREFFDRDGLNKKYNMIRKLLFLKAKSIVAVSNDIRRWLIERIGVPERKVRTIINGVDTEKFCPPKDKAIAKKKIGIDPSKIVIGSVGRLDKVKNYKMLINALSMVAENSQKFCAVLVGDGSERKNLEKLASEKGLADLIFTGQRNNVIDYLQAFDLFVLPSVAEGISNTILEAMACGLYVIATDVGGNKELIEDGKNGTLTPSNDTNALFAKIHWCLMNFEDSMRICEFAQKKCRKQFSLKHMLLEYESLYLQAIKNTKN